MLFWNKNVLCEGTSLYQDFFQTLHHKVLLNRINRFGSIYKSDLSDSSIGLMNRR